jgi:predicted nucleic acid-binding protein
MRSSPRHGAPDPRTLAILDTSVLVKAFLSTDHVRSPARRVVELGAAGVYRAVLSAEIIAETREVLGRPRLRGYSTDQVDEVLGPLWRTAHIIELAPDDPAYAKVVSDARDVHLIRAAAAVYLDPAHAILQHYLVTENAMDFPPGRHWSSFEYVDPLRFPGCHWRALNERPLREPAGPCAGSIRLSSLRDDRIRVTKVAPLPGRAVRLTLTDGSVVDRDLTDILAGGGVFAPIEADETLFRQVYVDYGTIAWPGDVDLAPETLIWDGPDPADDARRPEPFLRPQPPPR